MKSFLLMVLGVVSAAAFAEPTVLSVKVSQLWPFESSVRVDYVLTGVTDPVDVTPTFYDGDVELVSSAKAGDADSYSGDLHRVGNGAHAFTFDPQKVLGGAKKRLALRCKLTLGASEANMSDVLYRVIDLKTGAIEDICRADFYDNKYGAFETSYEAVRGACKAGTYTTTLDEEFIWTGVTNNPAYKTTKLVLRYIKCKDRVWRQGLDHSVSGSYTIGSAMPEHDSMFTKNYFISVFKVTQEQYFQLKGAYTGGYLNVTNEETQLVDHTLPVYNVSRKTVRGAETNADPTDTSFFGQLKAISGLVADIPTDAQWEYAGHAECDMGKNGDMPNGTTEFAYIAHASENNASPASVGCYQPNAFGLYDVIGNGQEMVFDDYVSYGDESYLSQTNELGVVVDPMGPHSGGGDVIFRSTTFAPKNAGAGNRNASLFTRDKRSSGQGLCSFRVRIDESED